MVLRYKTESTDTPYVAMVQNDLPLDNFVYLMKLNDLPLDVDFSLASYDFDFEETEKVSPKGGQVVVRSTSTSATILTNSSQNIYDFILNTSGNFDSMVEQLKAQSFYFESMNAAVKGVFVIEYQKSFISDFSFKLASKNIDYTTGDNTEGAAFDYSFDYSFDS